MEKAFVDPNPRPDSERTGRGAEPFEERVQVLEACSTGVPGSPGLYDLH